MGLFGKIKNILFDEEDIDMPINEKKVVKEEKKPAYVEKPRVEASMKIDVSNDDDDNDTSSRDRSSLKDLFDEEDFLEKKEDNFINRDEELVPRLKDNDFSKPEPSFHFPMDFEDNDFNEVMPSRQSTTNVITIEKEKNPNYDKYTITKKEETTIEKHDFKASPIISPIYGIMDKNYKKEDIFEKPRKAITKEQQRSNEIDAVRKKAFGTLEDDIESTLNRTIDDFYGTKDTQKKVEKLDDELTAPIKTIDELLIGSMNEEEKKENKDKFERASDLNETFKLDEVINEMKKTSNNLSNDEDLFKLIDSMYEERDEDK